MEANVLADIPRQQLGDTFGRMISNAADDVVQIGLGINAIEFGSLCRAPNYAEWPHFPQDSR